MGSALIDIALSISVGKNDIANSLDLIPLHIVINDDH